MDLKVLLGTCVTIFLAEIGDKTQLAVFGGTAATRKPVEIFLGACMGLIAATAIAVVLGQAAGHVVPEKLLRMAGGTLFLCIGLWMLLRSGT